MIKNIYSGKITELREKAGMTRSSFAERVNTDEETVTLWESGEKLPSAEEFYRMSKLFGVSMESFFVLANFIK